MPRRSYSVTRVASVKLNAWSSYRSHVSTAGRKFVHDGDGFVVPVGVPVVVCVEDAGIDDDAHP